MNSIKIENLSFNYGQKQVLNNVSLEIKRGAFVSVLGHNGSGKSTLAKLIMGLLEPSSGNIYINDTLMTKDNVYDLRTHVGIVFQNPDNQFVGVTVKDDIAFGMENLLFSKEEIIKNIDYYSEMVSMKEYLKKSPHELSGGQKQRVAIAGVLAMGTEIVIFDEATSMLDPTSRDEIIDYIKTLNKLGITTIVITHDIKEVIESDQVFILKQGELLANGNTKEILQNKELLKQSNLELLLPLQIVDLLEDYDHDGLKEYLWQLSLVK